jgi:hypothetical protein
VRPVPGGVEEADRIVGEFEIPGPLTVDVHINRQARASCLCSATVHVAGHGCEIRPSRRQRDGQDAIAGAEVTVAPVKSVLVALMADKAVVTPSR